MINLTAALRRAKELQTVQPCSNEECLASRWKRWSSRGNGVYLNDRWYCSESCLESALLSLVVGTQHLAGGTRTSVHRLPLGLLMLSRGVIDESQLKAALAVQGERPSMKIGRCLETMGAVTGREVTRALGAQHCLPVLVAFQPELESGVPLTLLEASRCVAFRGNYHAGLLYLGFDGAIDRPLLAAAEFVMGVQCEPCIVDTRIIEEHLDLRRQRRNPDEIVFETKNTKNDMVRSIQSYVHQVGADVIRLAPTRQYLWANLQGARPMDLLFRVA